MDEEHYVFVGDYFIDLLRGQAKIEHIIEKIKVKFMTPEEKKRHELLEQQKAEI